MIKHRTEPVYDASGELVYRGYPIADYTAQELFMFLNDDELMDNYEQTIPDFRQRIRNMYKREVEHKKYMDGQMEKMEFLCNHPLRSMMNDVKSFIRKTIEGI